MNWKIKKSIEQSVDLLIKQGIKNFNPNQIVQISECSEKEVILVLESFLHDGRLNLHLDITCPKCNAKVLTITNWLNLLTMSDDLICPKCKSTVDMSNDISTLTEHTFVTYDVNNKYYDYIIRNVV